ncbi:MAG: DNA-formamidopyrimidine glycosylase [Gammaproteobacteria bacterium RIFCSPLOWO2_02_FULL_61_13]|nr:MAG: DNA-formamidopyrimidine glycosylase [Gammaproteobacteria bacterium RIFCSPLOWO2_02_FULL_61_13]
MPELPEVETTRQGILRAVAGRRVKRVVVRDARLRWRVPAGLARALAGQRIETVERRGKYLIFRTPAGSMLMHLGMSGSLRIVPSGRAPEKHEHIDLMLDSGTTLRFRDPRRFGSVLWTTADPLQHKLLRQLGPEPLERDFSGDYLFERAAGRRQGIKTFIMDSHIVVGVGNIYASEALFGAGIHPVRAAGRISRARYQRLAGSIRRVLRAAIRKGGTTLRDFVNDAGEPGYFRVKLQVYDRAGQPCRRCGETVRAIRSGQRSTFYCPACQH